MHMLENTPYKFNYELNKLSSTTCSETSQMNNFDLPRKGESKNKKKN